MTTPLPSTAESQLRTRSSTRAPVPIPIAPERPPLNADEFWKRLGM